MSKFIAEYLSKVEHSIRSSQAVYQYGVGGMVDFKDQTLMTSSAEFWDDRYMKVVNDERLAKTLNVDYFKAPGQDNNSFINYVRFPRWYFCPSCKRIKPIEEWQKEYKSKPNLKYQYEKDPFMIKHMKCPKCQISLVVTRLVTVCKNGHIDDFPWIKLAHKNKKIICEKPELTLKTYGTTGSYNEMIIECKCGAREKIGNPFGNKFFENCDEDIEGIFSFKCSGNHPWKHKKERCDCYPVTQQRGGTNVYYPFVLKSLVIPPYSDELTILVESSNNYMRMTNRISEDIEDETDDKVIYEIKKSYVETYSKKIANEINKSIEDVTKILERKQEINEEKIEADSIQYKSEEYDALIGKKGDNRNFLDDFIREETNIEDYNIPFLKRLVLVHKVKEVRVQTGFTRLNPVEKTEKGTNISEDENNIVSIKSKKMNWYPAYQVYGEGIFIELDQDMIDEWILNNPAIIKRTEMINTNYSESYNHTIGRKITPRFLLLHTLSHLLIKQLSFECGYNIASLCERLYCSETVNNMAGILIYTAQGDSEGTLGGLVRQGRKDTFPRIFKKAIEEAVLCSNDPVCSLSNGQGKDGLNLSACYSCSLLPETTCEEFNCFLDRSVLVGTFDDRMIGLYSEYLYNGKEWKCTVDISNRAKNGNMKKFKIVDGTHNNCNYKRIWDSLCQFALPEEENVFKKLIVDSRFDNLEKPITGPKLINIENEDEEYYCDVLWESKKVCLFTKENEDDYKQLKNSEYKCFLILEDDLPNKLYEVLKG